MMVEERLANVLQMVVMTGHVKRYKNNYFTSNICYIQYINEIQKPVKLMKEIDCLNGCHTFYD